MRPPTSTELLHLWENSFDQTKLDWALHLLAIACSTPNLETAAQWDISQRDGRLFQLRAWMFGTHFTNTTLCPKCNEKVEWEMNISDFPIPALQLEASTQTFTFEQDGYHIRYRQPNSQDIMTGDPEKILDNCLITILKEQTVITYHDLPDSTKGALNTDMEKANPLAHISMQLSCPSCQNQWEVIFDIIHYLWTEVDQWAKHILQEVYLLARAFGWSEQEILNLSPRRRQYYLQMIRS